MFELFGISRLELTRHLYGVLTTPSTMHNRRSMSNVMCTVFRFIVSLSSCLQEYTECHLDKCKNGFISVN